MRTALFCLLVTACLSEARAQSDSSHANPPASNAVYAELGGSALYYSFNYDRMVIPAVGFRTGFSLVEGEDKHWALLLPVFVNLLPGANSWSSSNLELNAGVVYHSGEVSIWYETANTSGIFYSLGLGYRYESADDGILFRITLMPLIFSDQSILYGGVSLGWAF
jgi:hypothetical protein